MFNIEKLIINHLCSSLELANNNKSHLPKFILQIDGMSSPKVRHLLNNVCRFDDCNYLEVGLFRGSTFCSAIWNNPINAWGIDHFQNFRDLNIVKKNINYPDVEFYQNLEHVLEFSFSPAKLTKIFNLDAFSIDLGKIDNFINVYFYDGDHQENSQYLALKYFYPVLNDLFIFIVDDYRQSATKDGTLRAIKELKLDILYFCDLPGDDTNFEFAMTNYWNGLGVFLLRKSFSKDSVMDHPVYILVKEKIDKAIYSLANKEIYRQQYEDYNILKHSIIQVMGPSRMSEIILSTEYQELVLAYRNYHQARLLSQVKSIDIDTLVAFHAQTKNKEKQLTNFLTNG